MDGERQDGAGAGSVHDTQGEAEPAQSKLLETSAAKKSKYKGEMG
jgi:hypothetical protein